jgi:dTDP-4-amino-4,6-dideoxygalactose transaminase
VIVQGHGISETPKILQSVESDLLQKANGKGIVWCGRAATGLYWAYRVASSVNPGISNPEVIVPAISCTTPANVALLTGFTPRFADVDPQTGMITVESVKARWNPRTCAVVFIHLFGQTTDLGPLAEWCRSKNIKLIEDNAQALGAHLPGGRPVGAASDMSVYSFNKTKILECGGGALLIRSGELLQTLDEELKAHPLPQELDADRSVILELSYRNLHHALVALLRLRAASEISDLFLGIRPAYEGLFLRAMKNPDGLALAWHQLPTVLAQRYQKAEIYANKLEGGPWHLLNNWRESGVCWRYSLLVNFPNHLVSFSESIRQDGFHVSNLYWPVNQFFYPDDLCPHADAFSRGIINLWVDESVDIDWVQRCAERLWKNIDQFLL